jgi:hypothetical protein
MKVAIAEARLGNGQKVLGFPTSTQPTANDQLRQARSHFSNNLLKSAETSKLNEGYQNIEHANMFGHEILRP